MVPEVPFFWEILGLCDLRAVMRGDVFPSKALCFAVWSLNNRFLNVIAFTSWMVSSDKGTVRKLDVFESSDCSRGVILEIKLSKMFVYSGPSKWAAYVRAPVVTVPTSSCCH